MRAKEENRRRNGHVLVWDQVGAELPADTKKSKSKKMKYFFFVFIFWLIFLSYRKQKRNNNYLSVHNIFSICLSISFFFLLISSVNACVFRSVLLLS